jgi:hypothetical protein
MLAGGYWAAAGQAHGTLTHNLRFLDDAVELGAGIAGV